MTNQIPNPKSQITPEVVSKIAQLGRLALTNEETTNAAVQLTSILDHFSAIQAIETKNVPTADAVSGLQNISRPDEAKPEKLASHENLLKIAPDTANGQVKVKAVFNV